MADPSILFLVSMFRGQNYGNILHEKRFLMLSVFIMLLLFGSVFDLKWLEVSCLSLCQRFAYGGVVSRVYR
jgi:hypothetical protein